MEEPQVYYINRNSTLSIASAIILILGIIISWLIYSLNLFEVLFITTSLFAFYIVLLLILMSTGHLRVIKVPQRLDDIKMMVSGEVPISQIEASYIGSTKTRKYHKNSCSLVKNIPSEFRIYENEELFFTKKKFKPCKRCIKKGNSLVNNKSKKSKKKK
jgi:hypothetical protein